MNAARGSDGNEDPTSVGPHLDDGGEAIAALRSAIELVASLPSARLGTRDAVLELFRLGDVLDAEVCRAAAAFEDSGAYADDEALSAAAWLSVRARMPKSLASRRIRLGKLLAKAPALRVAWSNGELGAPQAQIIASLDRPPTAEVLARDEELLVRQATGLSYNQFVRASQYWRQHADQDGAEDRAARQHELRRFALSRSFEGVFLGSLSLDPIGGEIVSNELERLERRLFEADRQEASERLGRAPQHDELSRTPAQRRADALVEMATRSAALLSGARRPVPLFNVLIDFPTMSRVCELAAGVVVTPGSLVPYLSAADLERAVWRAPRRVEVGVRSRLFSGATRRAVELRDRTCTHPFCDAPVERCQVDHIVAYSEGGETTQENGRLLCPRHNRLRNRLLRVRAKPPRPPRSGPRGSARGRRGSAEQPVRAGPDPKPADLGTWSAADTASIPASPGTPASRGSPAPSGTSTSRGAPAPPEVPEAGGRPAAPGEDPAREEPAA